MNKNIINVFKTTKKLNIIQSFYYNYPFSFGLSCWGVGYVLAQMKLKTALLPMFFGAGFLISPKTRVHVSQVDFDFDLMEYVLELSQNGEEKRIPIDECSEHVSPFYPRKYRVQLFDIEEYKKEETKRRESGVKWKEMMPMTQVLYCLNFRSKDDYAKFLECMKFIGEESKKVEEGVEEEEEYYKREKEDDL